ncbi:hypothetical protein ACHQM5_000153 [Ranunculus cassubicifolius]
MANSNQESFQQFSDQLRLQGSGFSNLSINDSIWSNSFTAKRPEERRNFDIRVGAERSSSNNSFNGGFKNQNVGYEINGFNNGWKIGIGEVVSNSVHSAQKSSDLDLNGGFNKGNYFKPEKQSLNNNFDGGFSKGDTYFKLGNESLNNFNGNQRLNNNNNNFNTKFSNNNGKVNEKSRKNEVAEGKKKSSNSNNNGNGNSKSGVDKRFKTLPASESLPRGEIIGGYIFVCNNDTMQENLQRQLFGLPPRYRDSVRAITPGLPLFLYNYSNHQLHGIFEASSFGGTNIDPTAWEDKKSQGESRFPAQVRVVTRKICDPLEEDSFRPILHHYDGPKFRLELSVPEALALLDVFAESS